MSGDVNNMKVDVRHFQVDAIGRVVLSEAQLAFLEDHFLQLQTAGGIRSANSGCVNEGNCQSPTGNDGCINTGTCGPHNISCS